MIEPAGSGRGKGATTLTVREKALVYGRMFRTKFRPLRTLTAEWRALPDFVIIGGQKCGTTTLHHHLCRHPQVLRASVKEVHFFDSKFGNGPAWYRSHFPLTAEVRCRRRLKSGNVITGEATPYYLFHPHAPGRLSQVVPEAKLIVLLRDPVHRAYSHYIHNSRNKHRLGVREPLSFAEAIAREDERLQGELDRMIADDSYDSWAYRHYSYARKGIYVEQLEAYERHFDRGQILALSSEEFFGRTQVTFDRVLSFLDLDPLVLADERAKNVGHYSKERRDTDEDLRRTFDELRAFFAPHNRMLYEHLQRDFGW